MTERAEIVEALKRHQEGAWDSADFRRIKLRDADLPGVNMIGVDFRDVDMSGANLRGAILRGADMRGAILRSADLSGANLSGANLRDAILMRAIMGNAYLTNALLPPFQIPQEGSLTVWGKKGGKLVRMLVPDGARRTASLVGRKCRAEYAVVEWVEGGGTAVSTRREFHHSLENDRLIVTSRALDFEYVAGTVVEPDFYDPDIRVECTHGIHFFLTREEAEAWK